MQCFWMMLIDMCVIFSTQLHRKAWRSNNFWSFDLWHTWIALEKTPNVTKYDNMWQYMTQNVTKYDTMRQNMTQCDCTPGEIFCILNPVFPTCQFMFEKYQKQHVTNTKYMIQNIKQTTKQILFYQSAKCCLQDRDLTPKLWSKTSSCFSRILWTEKTVNWKDGHPCLHFQHKHRHQSVIKVFLDICIHLGVHLYSNSNLLGGALGRGA